MSRYIDAEPWESMGASVKFEYPNKCDDPLIGHIMIRDIHTADVSPVVHGRWILEREPNGKPYCFHCSVCDSDYHCIGIVVASDYCPNCGAKMDGGTEND